MICKNCGKDNKAGNIFCEFCGTELDLVENMYTDDTVSIDPIDEIDNEISVNVPHSMKKIAIIAGSAVALVIVGIVVMLMAGTHSKANSAKYNDAISDGDMYYEEMDYENAEDCYLDAINIDPKKEDAYIKAADMYVEQNKEDKCLDILSKGKKQTGSSTISKRVDKLTYEDGYETYIEDEIIPEEGVIPDDTTLYKKSNVTGLVSSGFPDLDDDGVGEMFTVSYKVVDDNDIASVALYEYEDEKVNLIDRKEVPLALDELETCDICSFYGKFHEDDFYLVENVGEQDVGSCLRVFAIDKDDGIEQELYLEELQGPGVIYSINGKEVASFVASDDFEEEYDDYDDYDEYDDYDDYDEYYEYEEDPFEEAEEKGKKAFNDELSKYGLGNKAANDSYDSNNYSIFKDADDENDETETTLCRFEFFYSYDDDVEVVDIFDETGTSQ